MRKIGQRTREKPFLRQPQATNVASLQIRPTIYPWVRHAIFNRGDTTEMTQLDYKLAYRKKLPHIQPPGAMLFVTFRLAGSLPTAVLDRLMAEKSSAEERLSKVEDLDQRHHQAYEEQKKLFAKWDSALDRSQREPRWLQRPDIAKVVADALHHLDHHVYELDTFCIMSNHVHVVFRPLEKEEGTYHALAAIMHSLKRHTARQANKKLGREGKFWQHESYDHVVRDVAELQRIRRYVLENPVRAGLVDDWRAWPWSYCLPCEQ